MQVGSGAQPIFEASSTLSTFASSLFTWISLMSLHDMQLVGWQDKRPSGQEELLVYLVTDATIWAIVSHGLTGVSRDWSQVRFGLRALASADACRLADAFLRPIPELTLPEEFYGPTPPTTVGPTITSAPRAWSDAGTGTPVPPPAAESTAPPTTPSERAMQPMIGSAPAWNPTHRAPDAGMPAWAAPDPGGVPVARIDPRVELQLLERAGDWAHIVCSNGWSAWVNGRAIRELQSR
jgi:hypothetical protein